VNKLRLLIGAALRSQLRWAGEHLYYWLVLGPVVVGFTTFTVARVVDNLSAWQPAPSGVIAAAIGFELALVALSLSRATAEIYHLRRPEAYFDALPIARRTHLHAGVAARTGRTRRSTRSPSFTPGPSTIRYGSNSSEERSTV